METTPFGYYSQIGKRNRIEEAKTSDYTILASEVGKSFSNSGASAAIVLTLPIAKRGMVFTFHRKAQYDLSFNTSAADTDFIREPIYASTGIKKITLSSPFCYPSVRVVCLEDGFWTCQILSGTDATTIRASGTRTASKSDRGQTDDVTLTDIDSGQSFDNEGAEKSIVFTLPSAEDGMEFTFDVLAAYRITITPASGEQITNPFSGRLLAADTSLVNSGVIGNTIKIKCINDTEWVVVNSVGKWLQDIPKTADYTVLASQDGCTFNNFGDANAIVFTLPSAVVGMEYSFDVLAAQQMTITPASGEQIANPFSGRLLAADTSLVNSGVIGNTIKLKCIKATEWVIVGISGKWLQDITKTADFTVLASQDGCTFNNAGDDGTIVFTLPTAVVGMKYIFHVQAAQELRIDPNASETIALPSTGAQSAAGKYIVADAIGEMVEIECKVVGTWNVNRYIGTWGAEA